MNCKIYLFRHGQTHFNYRKRFTGWLDSDWTTTGHRNASKTAQLLKRKHIDVAFSSHLKRSKHTLARVLKHHPECRLHFVDDRMIERCYGAMQGHSHDAFIQQHGQELFDRYHRSYTVQPPEGESLNMVEERVRSFATDLVAFIREYNVNVAVSAHGNSIRMFRMIFEHSSVKEMLSWNIPYDRYFEYDIEVPETKNLAILPTKKSWKSVLLPKHVLHATDKKNTLRKYY